MKTHKSAVTGIEFESQSGHAYSISNDKTFKVSDINAKTILYGTTPSLMNLNTFRTHNWYSNAQTNEI
jgi:hypothetical protein